MTSFVVGIIVLIVVTLAVSKSLVSERKRGSSASEGLYDDESDGNEYAEPDDPARARTRQNTDAMVDDFVLQDAVEEDESLTGVWED